MIHTLSGTWAEHEMNKTVHDGYKWSRLIRFGILSANDLLSVVMVTAKEVGKLKCLIGLEIEIGF